MIGVYVVGDFQNIKSIIAEQTYPALLRCTRCGVEHAKYVSAQPREEKHSERGCFDSAVTCTGCKDKIGISASAPKASTAKCTDARDGMSCWASFLPGQDGFLVSEVETTSCDIVDIPRIEISVLTEEDILFRDVFLENGSWEGVYKDCKRAMIDSYEVLIRKIPSS